MAHFQNKAARPNPAGTRRKTLLKKIIFMLLGSAAFAIWLAAQGWLLQTLLADRIFLQQASASAWGSVSTVSTSVLANGDGPATILCSEVVTFQPIGNSKPVTFTTNGANGALTQTDETCSNQGDTVLVLYNPQNPADARVAEVIHDELVIYGIQEGILSLFTLSFLASALHALALNLRVRWKKHK